MRLADSPQPPCQATQQYQIAVRRNNLRVWCCKLNCLGANGEEYLFLPNPSHEYPHDDDEGASFLQSLHLRP